MAVDSILSRRSYAKRRKRVALVGGGETTCVPNKKVKKLVCHAFGDGWEQDRCDKTGRREKDKTGKTEEHESRGKLVARRKNSATGLYRITKVRDEQAGGCGFKYNEIQEGRKSERYPFSFLHGEWMLCERTAEKTRIPMYGARSSRHEERVTLATVHQLTFAPVYACFAPVLPRYVAM